MEDNEDVLNASHILNHGESLVCEENAENILIDDSKLQVSFSKVNQSQSNMTDTSFCEY